MYCFLAASQAILFIVLVYFGSQQEGLVLHSFLGCTILVVSILTCLLACYKKRKNTYHYIVLAIICFSSLIGYLLRKEMIPIFWGDYLGLFMQFGIVYSLLLLFDLSKVPNLLAKAKIVKVSMMLVSWQIISGVILRGQNKAIIRLEEKAGFLLFSIHIFLAIFTFVALLCLSFHLLEVAKKQPWFKKWGIALLVMIALQVVLGVVALFSSFRPLELSIASEYISPLHFINSGFILFVILLLKKGQKA